MPNPRKWSQQETEVLIWEVAHASGRLTGHSETVRRAGRPFGKLPILRLNAPPIISDLR